MRISAARTFDEVLADQVADDPEFRAEWERTTLARAVANAVITYRLDRKLSSASSLSSSVGNNPQVARLELGESNPSFATLCDLAPEARHRAGPGHHAKGPTRRLVQPRAVGHRAAFEH
jgi:hypothetical protein